MKRGIEVAYMNDSQGWGFKRITKNRGQLTIDEIRQALIDDGDQGYYAVILKCIDDDMQQYYDDDLPEDVVDAYDADSFMMNSGRAK